jgi:hypothetical protein
MSGIRCHAALYIAIGYVALKRSYQRCRCKEAVASLTDQKFFGEGELLNDAVAE